TTPASLFAPKAIIAALPLLPEATDSLRAHLDSAYAASPYTLALRGEPSPAYAAAEDSLAVALGMQVLAPTIGMAIHVAAPTPGPRGPAFEPPLALLNEPNLPSLRRTPVVAPGKRPTVRPEDRP